MTHNGTDAQVDTEKEVNANQNAQTGTESKSGSHNQEHTDHPSNILDFPIEKHDDDSIGMEDILDGMVKYINHAQMPFTIAVQGEWGIGKTSFLNLLKNRLCEDNISLYYSVWIDACDFALLQSPISAVINILQSMVYQIGHLKPVVATEQQGEEYIKKASLVAKNLGKFAAKKLITSGAKVATAGIVSEEMIDEVAGVITNSWSTNDKQSNNQDSNLSAIKQLRDDISSLIKDILDPNNDDTFILAQQDTQQTTIKTDKKCIVCNWFKSPKTNNTNDNLASKEEIKATHHSAELVNYFQKKRGIVFFIDNLDRIDPTLAVEILEITKNIFDFDRSVFIVALDNNIALRGLQKKLGTLTADNEQTFRAYFDKFVQQSITLPPQTTTVSVLLFELLVQIGYFTKNELQLSLSQSTLTQLPPAIILTKTESNTITSNIQTSLKDVLSNFASDLFKEFDSNPRSIKRFVNTLSLLLHIRQAKNSNISSNFSNLKFATDSSVDITTKALMFIVLVIKYSFPEIYEVMSSGQITAQLYPSPFTAKSVLGDLDLKLHQELNSNNSTAKSTKENYNHAIDQVIFTLKSIENMDQSIIHFNARLGEAIEIMIFCKQKLVFEK